MKVGDISKKVLVTQSIQFKNGCLFIWGIPAMILSGYSFAYLLKIASKIQEVKSVIYWSGYYQAVGAAGVTMKRFGYKKKILENVVGQSDMLGYGKIDVRKQDYKNVAFNFKVESAFAKEVFNIFGKQKEPIDHLFRGLFAGTVSTLCDEEVLCIETLCMAKGNKNCEFIVKKVSDFDLNDEFIKSQIPKKLSTPEELGERRKTYELPRRTF